MADVITRFRLETTQFDSKLRDTSKNMSALVKHMSLAGDEFGKFTQSSVEQARALGKIESGASNLKDKLKDLVGAYNDVARQYNVLTKEQQNTEFGKALAESLQTLQGRIRDTKAEMNAVPGVLDKLADKFTVNVDAMKLFDMGLQAAGAALDVAKDAFLQSESNIDEWGRTVEGAKGAYDVFLDTLNSGNWSSFFSNLEKAIQGGRDLYDALDRLGSIKANNQAAIALVQQQIQQLRVLKQQGKDVDDQIKSATQRLKELQSQSVTAGRTAGRMEIVNTLRNEVAGRNTTGVQVSDSQLRAAAERILKEGQSYFDGMRKVMQQYEDNAKYQSQQVVYSPGGTPTTEARFDISRLTREQQQQYLIAKAITEGETRVQQGISTFARAVQEGAQMTREEFRGNRYALQGSGSTGGRTSSGTTKAEQTELQKNQKAISDMTEEYQRLADVSKTATGQALSAATERMTSIKTEIKALQDRNDELKRWADEAASKTTGLIEEQTKKAARLNEELTHATTVADIQRINKELEATNDRLTILRGKLPENKTAEFKVEVDAKQLAELQDKLPKGATITERVNVEQGKVDMPDVPTDVKQLVTVTADTAEAAQAIAALVDGNYTVTISAKMNMEEGFAGLSDNALSAYIAGLKKDLSGEEIGSDFYNKIAQNMGDATALQNVIKAAVSSGLDISGFDFEMPWEKILSFDDADGALTSLIDQINEKLKEIGKDPIVIDLKTGDAVSKDVVKNAKETQQAWSAAASAINSASSAMQNIEDPAAKVTGIVMQAIANIALGFSKQSIEAAGGGPLAWIAATLSGLSVMTSTIAAIKSATKGFAEGGIVPGNSFSGDMLRTSDYGINSGELILNKAQQNSIAGQLEQNGNSLPNGGTPYVTGETVILGINNTLRRQGRGELVTTGTLRRLGIM